MKIESFSSKQNTIASSVPRNAHHTVQPSVHNTEPMDSSDDISSVSSYEESRYNNRRLTQAINYIAAEGAGDSLQVFIDRVNRIEELLVQQLPHASVRFDRKLLRRLKAMIRAIQREYEDAMGHSSLLESDDDLPVNEEGWPDLKISPTVYALHRGADQLSAPTAELLQARKILGEKKDKYERKYKYGGCDKVETWMAKYPCMLPFPDTFQLAAWESLKINFDISEQGKKLKATGAVIETRVSWEHPALERFKTLDLYESGSRFTLPDCELVDREYVVGIVENSIPGLVQKFNKGPGNDGRFAPRVILESFKVNNEVTPNAVRQAMNTTPTRAYGSEKSTQSTKTTKSQPPHATSPSPAPKARSAALRRIQKEIEAALKASPRRQSSITTITKSNTHPVAKYERKKSGSRPPMAQSEPSKQSRAKLDSTHPSSSRSKRKRSKDIKTASYNSSFSKSTRNRGRKTVQTKAVFDRSDVDDETEIQGERKASKGASSKQEAKQEGGDIVERAVKVTSRGTVSGKIVKGTKATKRQKNVYEERVSAERYKEYMQECWAKHRQDELKRGRTRSGKPFKDL